MSIFNPNAAKKLIMELFPIAGLSGHEDNIAAFVRKKLLDAGVAESAITTDTANKRSPIGGVMGNLICKLPGTQRAPRRLLMAHLDTVPICAGTIPVEKDGFIVSGNPKTGLGADNRSGVAAILNAALTILNNKLPHPPLTLFFPVQEEVGLFGARFCDVKKLGDPKLCFNWDSSDANKITIGATGAYRIQVQITGLASHAGVYPEKGVSAIGIAGLAIAEMQKNGWHGLVIKNGKRGTTNIGTITAGSATNVVADSATLRIEARSHDSQFRKRLVKELKGAFERAVKSVKSAAGKRGSFTFDAELHYESFKIPESTPVVKEAQRVIKDLGMEPELKISNGGLDANWLTEHGLPTVTLGAGQEEVHTLKERLRLEQFYKGCEVALALATGS